MAGTDPKDGTPAQHVSPHAVKTFQCPSCGAPVTIRAIGQSLSVVCGSCSAIIDPNDENYKILQKISKSGERQQLIPLGTRGKLRGVTWEVIGYVEKMDEHSKYQWSEYLLFNPTKDFRWLTESDGHWNYVLMIKNPPLTDSDLTDRTIAKYMNKKYFLFNRGAARVEFVVGEFYWQVKIGERYYVEDFVNSPEILSLEQNKNEAVWSVGEYVDAQEIKTAFAIEPEMPLSTTVAPNQPTSVTEMAKYSNVYWSLFLGLLLMLQIVFMISSRSTTVYTETFNFDPGDAEKIKVTTPFELKGGMSNVEIKLSSPVVNNWLSVQGDLVNDGDGETEEFEQGVEYYAGYDSDGSWSEGSTTNSIILSSIPAGTYHLNFEATAGQPALTRYEIVVKRDVPTWSNFIWACILLSIFPLFIWWRNRSVEMERWSQSDFSPFSAHHEGSGGFDD